LHWIHRCAVRTGSAIVLGALAPFWALAATPAAKNAPSFWFGHQHLSFARASAQKGDWAVALHDTALQSVLSKLGVSVAWQNGERYVLLTTAEPRIISFAVGDQRYDMEDVSAQAPFAPFVRNGDVYLPLYTLLRALYLEPKSDRGQMVLQPQIASADVQSTRDGSLLVMHAAFPLHARRLPSPNGRVIYDFAGVGSTLERVRKVRDASLSEIDVQMGGTTRDPDTKVTIVLVPHARADDGKSGDHLDFLLVLHGGTPGFNYPAPPSPPPPAIESSPSPEPSGGEATPEPTAPSSAVVTGVEAQPAAGEFDAQISVSGNAGYEWHRLLDNRWYVDIHPAILQIAPRDETPSAAQVTSLRVRQLSATTVRVALTLTGQNEVDVTPSQSGLAISVKDSQADVVARSGTGSIGALASAAPVPSNWKFTPPPASSAPTDPRLIVIDPGHGGSDTGAQNSGLVEKTLTLDISSRLRSILLSRGWEVRMTRSSDTDVYGPGASDRDELQARVDVANNGGARLFVSVHVNSFVNGRPNGTTTYYYKAVDLPFASAIHRRLVSAALGTKDDGVIKETLYVVHHTTMPAVLVETAFLSNPDDRALLRSPDWLEKVARAIADGIGDYAGAPRASSQSEQR